MTCHATAVAINGHAVLLRGASGAGKSDVALRLLALPRDALRAFGVVACDVRLIADDRVVVERRNAVVVVSAPTPLRGKLEVRGIGIVDVAATAQNATLALVVDLVSGRDVERMPDAETVAVLDATVPRLKLSPFETSTPLKIALALSRLSPAFGALPAPSSKPRSE